MRPTPLILACAVLLVPAATASAAQTNAPPGNSGIGQYLEVVPSASGGKPTSDRTGDRSALSKRQRRELAKTPTGRSLAAAVADTSPSSGGGGGTTGGGAGASGAASTGQNGGSGATDSASSSLARSVGGDGGGLGVALPILLAVAGLGAVGLVVLRRRRRA